MVGEYKRFDEFGSLPVALSAIRTCYSPNRPSQILELEGGRYFKLNENGEFDASRLIKTIVSSGHSSVLEHVSFTFTVEDITRYTLGQLTRHRIGTSFSVQSGRYVNAKTDGRMGGAKFHIPSHLSDDVREKMTEEFVRQQGVYDMLVNELGVKAEDARGILGQANVTSLVFTINLRALLHFYDKRKPGNGAQAEASEMAVKLREVAVASEPWCEELFALMDLNIDSFHN
ncbi:MAG: FAD-dependent thymidylate synthase [Phocaeicola sp.]